VVTDGSPVTAAELWAFCEGKVPAFAIPRFVRFVAALPKTPSEKVRKGALRDDGITADTHDRTEVTVSA
jgi:crotonobetaine/carnitine-CoA ligase